MRKTVLPTLISCLDNSLKLEAYDISNQMELWHSILSDRKSPTRKNIWPSFEKFNDLSKYMLSCNFFDPKSEEYGYVIRNQQAELIGTFHIFEVDWSLGQAEFGYGLHHRFEGRGYAIRSLLAMEQAVLSHGLSEIKITCENWNLRSWKVAERCNYKLIRIIHKDSDCKGCDYCQRQYQKTLKVHRNDVVKK